MIYSILLLAQEYRVVAIMFYNLILHTVDIFSQLFIIEFNVLFSQVLGALHRTSLQHLT